MVRVAFHHERFYEIENLASECYKPKRIQLRITKDSMGRLDRLHTCLVGVAQCSITQLIKLCTPANLHFRNVRQS